MEKDLNPVMGLLSCSEDLGTRLKGGTISPFNAFLEFASKIELCFEGFGVDNDDLRIMEYEFPEIINEEDSPIEVFLHIMNSKGITLTVPVKVGYDCIGLDFSHTILVRKTIVFPMGFDVKEAGSDVFITNPVRISSSVFPVISFIGTSESVWANSVKLWVDRINEKVKELERFLDNEL